MWKNQLEQVKDRNTSKPWDQLVVFTSVSNSLANAAGNRFAHESQTRDHPLDSYKFWLYTKNQQGQNPNPIVDLGCGGTTDFA
ncbi:hypothetical protein E5D57_008687 [Metarhizium anisopliae]|nr:hypothetical protein E5D57_008687 [Metarhizium anisopliae]